MLLRRMERPRTVVLDPYNGGLAVARALVRRGERVTVIAGGANGFMLRTRGAAGRAATEAEWMTALEEVAAEGPAVVVTGGDVASEFLAIQRDRLPAGISAFETRDDAHLPLLRKDTSDAIARRAGVRVPWTATVTSAADLDAAADAAPYPAVLKPAVSHAWRALFGDHRVLLVDDADGARRAGQRALDAGLDMIMSEYVPGGDGDVEEAILVRAPDGSYPVFFGCHKLRQYPVGFGAASLCEVAELPETMALARAVLDEAGFVGVCGVETKRHAVTGERYFLEVNVRIPTQWGLGDAAGLDASARLAAVARGEQLGPQPPLQLPARLIFPELDVRAIVAALRAVPARRRPGELGRLLREYRGVGDVGLLDLRDPGPLAFYVGRALRRRVQARLS
jgi:predicted ATP-grasp superfamily ATP-dependent carboligase